MATLKCPVCGSESEAGNLICLECGSNLTRSGAGPAPVDRPAQASAPRPPVAARGNLNCPHCGEPVSDPGNIVCLECLRPLHIESAQSAGIRLVFASWEVGIPPGTSLLLGRGLSSPVAAHLAGHDNVSRHHATVTVGENGQADVLDEDSTNGTFVNDKQAARGQRVPLRDGDILRLASDVAATIRRHYPDQLNAQSDAQVEANVKKPKAEIPKDRRRSSRSAPSGLAPAVGAPRPDEYVPDPADIVELQTSWTQAIRHNPGYDADDSAKTVRYLAQRTGMNQSQIFQLRRVRNMCAHAGADNPWPSRYEFDMALATVRELLRRLSSSP